MERGTLTLRLTNGRELTTVSAFELACFWESDGLSIVPNTRRQKGGKSKGARGRGRKTVTRTRDAT